MKLNTLLYSFSGGDPSMIAQCGNAVKALFLKTGLFVPLLFVLCFISSVFTFSRVFSNVFISIMLALFFSWMIMNIYRLLLYTLAKNSLPHVSTTGSVVVSTTIRVAFICFICLFVSKPIESMLYSAALNRDIEEYKAVSKRTNAASILFYYRQQVQEIQKMSHNKIYQQRFIKDKEEERLRVTQRMYQLVDSSNYYLQRIRFLNTKHTSCWLITLVLMLVFTFPVYCLKCMKDEHYYAVKSSVEKRMVNEEYAAFKNRFREILKNKYGKTVAYSEPYSDSPYNTLRKTDDRFFLTEENLLSELYDA